MLIQHQQESPIWGMVEKNVLFSANSSTVIQRSCEKNTAVEQLNSVTAPLWNSMSVRPRGQTALSGSTALLQSALLSPTLLCLLFSTLVQQDFFGVSSLVFLAPSGEMQSLIFGVKVKNCAPRAIGKLTYVDKSPCPWSLMGLSYAMKNANPCSMIGSKGTVLIRMELLWWVSECFDVYSCTFSIECGSSSSIGSISIPVSPL